MHISLKINKTRDEIAQAYTHTQRRVNNAWSEIVSCSPCFAFIAFLLFIGSYTQYGITLIRLRTSIVALF